MTKRKFLIALGTTALLITTILFTTRSPESSPDSSSVASGRDKSTYRITDDGAPGVAREQNSSATGSSPAVSPAASPPDIPNFVRVEAPEHESWAGETCSPPRRGSVCYVLFQGGVHTKEEAAVVHFLAFENGKSEPAMDHQMPIKQGNSRINTWLEYRIGNDADWVEFRVELRNAGGEVLASNFPQRVPITVRAG